MYLETPARSAIYDVIGEDGADIAPILFEEAQATAQAYLAGHGAGASIEIARAFYEYMPVWEDTQLTLCPSWRFYAMRADKALYPVASISAVTGEILR